MDCPNRNGAAWKRTVLHLEPVRDGVSQLGSIGIAFAAYGVEASTERRALGSAGPPVTLHQHLSTEARSKTGYILGTFW